jgi:putative phage-type endonuclease
MSAARALDPASPFPLCTATGIRQSDRLRWLAARRQGLGGSEVAALLGLHPYLSALEVYADKIGELPAERATPEVALWGQIFEEPIWREYARRTGRGVRGSNELLRSIAKPWHLVTPDAMQRVAANDTGANYGASDTEADPVPDSPGTVEVKTTGYGNWEEEIPAHVLVQVQHGLAVTGAAWATLVWLPFPERKLQWRDYRPHPEFHALLAEKVDEFWTRVLMRRPPDADGSESARRALFALEPELVDESVAFDDAEPIADELEQIHREVKLMEARKDLIGNRVLQALGPYKCGLLEDGRYWNSWRVEGDEMRKGYRASRLMAPRKKPHAMPRERRQIVLESDPELAALLAASIERVRR